MFYNHNYHILMKNFYLFLALSLGFGLNAQVNPLPNAHAHNDYVHSRPLMEAIENGFTSVEADIHLIEGELYVTHDHPESVSESITLKALYLEPLKQLAEKNNGKIYPGYNGPFYLMIDIKTNADSTYTVLKKQLETYESMLSKNTNDTIYGGPVTIFLSGNRPFATVLEEKTRLVGLDGRPTDLIKSYASTVVPVISDSYRSHLKWRGTGEMPKEEWEWLVNFCEVTHAQGKKVRLWASPDNEVAWSTLLKAGVDLINTDKIPELSAFLSKNSK